MAEMVLKNAYVRIGSSAAPTALSTAMTQITINYSAELLDRTGFKSAGRSRIAGLKDWSMSFQFKQDFASSDIDHYFFDLIGTTGTWMAVRPTTAVRAAGNPDYIGAGLLESYSPISGGVGSLAGFSASFQCADGVALVRSVAAT